MVQKMMRNALFAALRHSPKVLRDRVFRSRLDLRPLPRDLMFEIARSRSDLDKAFQLLHDAYVREGFSKPHISGRRVTDYHALPSTTTLLAKCKEEVVATITVIRDGPFGLPADAVADFSDFRARGERLGEVSSLAINPRFRGRSGEVMFHLFKYMLHYSMYYFGLDRFVIVVNPDRITLYESILAFERIPAATVRAYSFANNAPGVCATLDLIHLEQNFQRLYAGRPRHCNIHQFFFGPYSLAEKRRFRFPERRYYTAMDPVMRPDIMDYFFNQCTDCFCHLDPRKVGILRHIYQEQAYASVWPRHMFGTAAHDRGHRRFDVTCNAAIVGCSVEGSVLPALDASRAGLRLRVDMPLRYLDRSLLEVAVGRGKRARVVADCRWRKGVTVGLRVVSADTDWHRFIDFMENRMARMAEAGAGAAAAFADPLAQMA